MNIDTEKSNKDVDQTSTNPDMDGYFIVHPNKST